jgi:hypothetical protein
MDSQSIHNQGRKDAAHEKYCAEMADKYGEDWDADDFLENEDYFKPFKVEDSKEPEGDPSY